MANETEKTEEKIEDVKVEEKVDAEVLDSAIKKGDEETKDEIPEEVTAANKAFDDKMDSEDDSAVEVESEEKKPDEAEKKAEEKDAGQKKEVEQTAKEKVVEDEAATIEKDILAAEQKDVAEKKAEDDKKAEAEKKSEEDKPFDCGLDPEEYDEAVIKQFNAQGQAAQDAAEALKSENTKLTDTINQQSVQRHTDWFDRKINGLGEDFKEVLGKGDIEDIEPASEQFENRRKIANRMALVTKTYQSLGKTAPARNKNFEMAVSYLHKDIANKSKNEADTKEKLKARASQAIGSGSKKGSTQSAATSIAKTNAEFDAKMDED